jgi:hypothetical protein
VIGPLPATERGTVLAGVNAKPLRVAYGQRCPRLRAAPSNHRRNQARKTAPRTKIRQSEVSTLSGDGRQSR